MLVDLLPILMLAAAFALFLLSTRPWRMRWRAVTWAGAAILVLAAAVGNASDGNSMGLLSTLVRHPDIVASAFQGNWPTAQAFVRPAVDVLVLLGALLAIGCLIAFTPGDRIERIIRPINIGLIGAIFGGALVLIISAVGFGPAMKRQVFMASINVEDLVDGDTIRVGDIGLRISGIDAPEDHQICLDKDGAPFDCGTLARDVLMKLALPGAIYCGPPVGSPADRRLQESFGRPLVSCSSDQQGYGQLPDIGREMVAMGYAYPYETPDGKMTSAYQAELATAEQRKLGLHSGLFIKPTEWRNNPAQKCDLVRDAGPVKNPTSEEGIRITAQLQRLREACGTPF